MGFEEWTCFFLDSNVKAVLLTTDQCLQEMGLIAGTPVGTSLIDAHAGGVGIMESVLESDSEATGIFLAFYAKQEKGTSCHAI